MLIEGYHFDKTKTHEKFVIFLEYTDKHIGDQVNEREYIQFLERKDIEFRIENRICQDIKESAIHNYKERFLEFLRNELESGTNQITLF